MSKQILISTSNPDKFRIVTDLLRICGAESFTFYNLAHFNLESQYQEQGTIVERAKVKCDEFDYMLEKVDAVIGIDDGISTNGKDIIADVKKVLPTIIEGKFVKDNSRINICRAFSVKTKAGSSETLTQIPLRYKENRKVKNKPHSYPLSYLLRPLNGRDPVAYMPKKTENLYYAKYCRRQLINTILEAGLEL